MNTHLPIRKILVLAANPKDTSGLRLDEEVRSIQQSIRSSKDRDRFQIMSEWAIRTEDLVRSLLSHRPHIVHFLGHGTGEQGLVLNDDQGRTQLVPTRALARLFQQLPTVECVLLNACYSDMQAQAISQYVSCVIGMNQPIGDSAAIIFSRGFYTALGHGSSYEAAYEIGRTSIDLEDIPEVKTPVLRTRAGKVTGRHDILSGGHSSGQSRRATVSKQVFISYRDCSPDKDLAQTIYESLQAAGHKPFMAAESIKLGESWRSRIKAELYQCDYFLLLLSPLSVTSEMVIEEVKHARDLKTQSIDNRPTILPVRVQFPLSDPLNYELRNYLLEIQQREWFSDADTPALTKEILAAVEESEDTRKIEVISTASNHQPIIETVDRPPLPVAEPELKREPGGSIPLASGLYVERPPIEAECFSEIEQPGALIRIKAPRQMGKTSLMARILSHARDRGYQTVPISFQRADTRLFNDLDQLLKWLCAQVGRRLNKLSALDDHWVGFGSKDKCIGYFEDCLLANLEQPLVLALDEVDLVFPHPEVADDFFALIRSWYEAARYGDFGSERWEKVRLIVVHSTEVYVPLNINQSPFNVGKNVELVEFTVEQVKQLAQRYGISADASCAEALMSLVGGHPYLIRKALYHLRKSDFTIETLVQSAATESGVYSDHLRRHLYVLQDYPHLAKAFQQIITKPYPVETDTESIFKLESMGLVKVEGNHVLPRCEVYKEYFKEHLLR